MGFRAGKAPTWVGAAFLTLAHVPVEPTEEAGGLGAGAGQATVGTTLSREGPDELDTGCIVQALGGARGRG